MLLVPASSGNATIQRDGARPEGAWREVIIQIDTLDSVILPQIAKLDLLKIDTEGFEDQVLAGAEELIARHRPLIYIELAQEYADASARAVAWLQSRGYKFDREVDLAKVRNANPAMPDYQEAALTWQEYEKQKGENPSEEKSGGRKS